MRRHAGHGHESNSQVVSLMLWIAQYGFGVLKSGDLVHQLLTYVGKVRESSTVQSRNSCFDGRLQPFPLHESRGNVFRLRVDDGGRKRNGCIESNSLGRGKVIPNDKNVLGCDASMGQ